MKNILILLFLFFTVNLFAVADVDDISCSCNGYWSLVDTYRGNTRAIEDINAVNNTWTCSVDIQTVNSYSLFIQDHGEPDSGTSYYKSASDTFDCLAFPVCEDGERLNTSVSPPVCELICDEGMHGENGVCVCDSEYVSSSSGGCMLPPDCKAEDEHSHYDSNSFLCACDENTSVSPFSGKCILTCGVGTNDIDCDNISNDEDDDIDGDGIPNDEDDDIDGDGIPNGEDDTPDGGGGGNSNDPEPDNCQIQDINSHDLNGVCTCNANYHQDITGFCVADGEIVHNPECDYPAIKDGYPFQDTTFTIGGCQYLINYFNGGTYSKLGTCDYYGCYYNTDDGGGDGNGTTPNDDDGDGIPNDEDPDSDGDGIDDNNSDIKDGGLFAGAKNALSDLRGKNINLNVNGSAPQAITFQIMGHRYVLFEPDMISALTWSTVQLVLKWIAIIASIMTIFATI